MQSNRRTLTHRRAESKTAAGCPKKSLWGPFNNNDGLRVVEGVVEDSVGDGVAQDVLAASFQPASSVESLESLVVVGPFGNLQPTPANKTKPTTRPNSDVDPPISRRRCKCPSTCRRVRTRPLGD
jgi:hypothetical protein